jgi:hypothetical protein
MPLVSKIVIVDPDSPFIRSVASCRLDLRRWGAKFNPNSQRPYFEGHERMDVVEHRREFIKHFLDRREFYYTISDGDSPKWIAPTKSDPCILLCKEKSSVASVIYFSMYHPILVHDESIFKSGETSYKRWAFDEETTFFSKGRGRSNMISDFLVQHESGPFFSLDQKQYQKAVMKYPQVSEIS